jgi:hypothetical protein
VSDRLHDIFAYRIPHLARDRGYALISQYIRLRPALQQAVDVAQGVVTPVDTTAAQQAAAEAALTQFANDPKGQLKTVAAQLQVAAPRWLPAPDAARMPAVAGGVVEHLDGVDYWRRNLTPVGV